MSRPSDCATLRRCLISASHQIIQIGSPHVLPHCKSVRGLRPPSNKETCLDYFVVPVSVHM